MREVGVGKKAMVDLRVGLSRMEMGNMWKNRIGKS